jgi:hypothetical protein
MKQVIPASKIPLDTMVMTWGLPYEVWLYSTAELHRTASIAVLDNPESMRWAKDDPKVFLTTWDVISYAQLPARYFIFSDTTTTYQFP